MYALQTAVMKGRGGVFTSLFHYARMFAAAGVRSTCLYSGPAAGPLRDGGIDVIEVPRGIASPVFFFHPDFARIRAEVCARGEPGFAMVHSDLALPTMKRMFPGAVVATRCHSDNIKHKRPADLIVTLNAEQQRMVETALPRNRVRMMGNPFVPAPDAPKPSGSEGPGGRLRVNFLGRIEQVKDPITLVNAFAAADLPADAELRFIGAGALEGAVKEAAAGSPRKVTLTGWIGEPYAQFDRGDILVFPSEWESYSWVVREALFYGVPVIASDIFVHRDALGGGGFGRLFPVGDWRALAADLSFAATHRAEMRVMAARGAEVLAQTYGPAPFWARLSAEIDTIRRARGA